MSLIPRLCLATRNPHKLRELRAILRGAELVPLPEDVELPPETADTFEGNALEKARAAYEGTGLPAIADDSGICAFALGGAPGVRSARYAGEGATDDENLARLLREMEAAGDDRRAAYVCVMALVGGASEAVFEGRCEGRLVREPRGEGGFGYDPAFLPDDTGEADHRTMAELSDEEKHAISHRGRAARALARHLGIGG